MHYAKRLLVVLAFVTIATGVTAAPRIPVDHEPTLQKIIRIVKGFFPSPKDASEMSVPKP
jgi:hypothetical protein